MKIGDREFHDECTKCGKIVWCELFRQGHGIDGERTNVAAMVRCQMEHKAKRTE